MVVERGKPYEIYKRKCNMYEEVGFSKKKCLQMG